MSNATKTVPVAPAAAQDFTQCPDWGQGGQFVFDQATGQRTRVGGPVAEPADAPAQADDDADQAAVAGADTINTPVKGKQRG